MFYLLKGVQAAASLKPVPGRPDTGVPIEHSKNLLAAYKKNHVPCELIVVKGGTHGFGGHDGFSDQEMPRSGGDQCLVRDTLAPEDNCQAGRGCPLQTTYFALA